MEQARVPLSLSGCVTLGKSYNLSASVPLILVGNNGTCLRGLF